MASRARSPGRLAAPAAGGRLPGLGLVTHRRHFNAASQRRHTGEPPAVRPRSHPRRGGLGAVDAPRPHPLDQRLGRRAARLAVMRAHPPGAPSRDHQSRVHAAISDATPRMLGTTGPSPAVVGILSACRPRGRPAGLARAIRQDHQKIPSRVSEGRASTPTGLLAQHPSTQIHTFCHAADEVYCRRRL